MSHLTILPTVLRDPGCLAASLEQMGLVPERGGRVEGFRGEGEAVDVRVTLADGLTLGWRRCSDGSLSLVADLQRLSRCRELESLLSRLSRTYAAREALAAAARDLPEAIVRIGA